MGQSNICRLVKVDLPNNATENKLEHTTVADTSNLAARKYFFALKAKVYKIEIAKLIDVPLVWIKQMQII